MPTATAVSHVNWVYDWIYFLHDCNIHPISLSHSAVNIHQLFDCWLSHQKTLDCFWIIQFHAMNWLLSIFSFFEKFFVYDIQIRPLLPSGYFKWKFCIVLVTLPHFNWLSCNLPRTKSTTLGTTAKRWERIEVTWEMKSLNNLQTWLAWFEQFSMIFGCWCRVGENVEKMREYRNIWTHSMPKRVKWVEVN